MQGGADAFVCQPNGTLNAQRHGRYPQLERVRHARKAPGRASRASPYPIDRVIVVDNGSSDDSVLVAKQAGAEVIELGRNTGFSHAVNAGIQSARTEWIAILNNDVSPKPDWLKTWCNKPKPPTAWFATGKLLDALARHLIDGCLRRHLPWRLRLEMRPRPFRFRSFGTSPARFGSLPSPRPFFAENCSNAWGCWMRNSSHISRISTSESARPPAVLQEFTFPKLSRCTPEAPHWAVGIRPAFAKLPAINCF